MLKRLIVVIAFTSLLGMAQTAVPDPYDGKLSHRTYSSTFFRFHCEMPPGFDASIGTAGDRRDAHFLVTGQKPVPGIIPFPLMTQTVDAFTHQPRPGVVLAKDAGFLVLADPQPSGEPFDVAKLIDEERPTDPKRAFETMTATYGGRKFYGYQSYKGSADKKKDVTAIFVTEANGYILRFAFTASDQRKFDELLRVMQTLQFD